MRNKKNIIKASSAQLQELEWYVGNKEVHLLRYYEPEPGIFIAESKNNRNRCYELSEQVTAQVATDGQMLQNYLDVQSTFDRYAVNGKR